MAPTSTKQWVIKEMKGFDSLDIQEARLPKLGDKDVLIEVDAVSLNYRDLIIPKGQYPFPMQMPRVPGSDACGSVVSIGSRVSRFKEGDKVCTLFNQGHQAGAIDAKALMTGLGGAVDGTLRKYAVFEETGLVAAPPSLTPIEASTLSCAPVTAWNALYGLESKALRPGDVVLTQGTGGVSIAALQFAVAAGCTVIATTSSAAKGKKLKELGAHHVINYRETQNWGEEAKKLTPGGVGVAHVIEVGGPGTMEQSMKAIKYDGVISAIGFLGGVSHEKQPSTLDALTYQCIVRGILVGSRLQFEEMNAAIEANKIKPVVDEKVFEFEQLKEAYQYMWEQKHFGKLVVKVK